MRINTNVSALNSQRILGNTGAAVSKNIAKLSSGFRITKAADDAAGLGIANQIRADIRATKQANRNAQQAVSVLQIMEGAGQQVQGIVERMKELAAQAGSDNVDSNARRSLNSEFDKLSLELDRIVDTTKFQGQTLLKGDFGSDTVKGVNLTGSTIDNVSGVSLRTASSATVEGLNAGSYAVTMTQGAAAVSNVGGLVKTTSIAENAGGLATRQGLEAGSYEVRASADGLSLELWRAGGTSAVATAGDGGAAGTVVLSGFDIAVTADIQAADGVIGTFDLTHTFAVSVADAGGGASTGSLTVNGTAQSVSWSADNHGIDISVAAGSNDRTTALAMNAKSVQIGDTKEANFLVSSSGDYNGQDLVSLGSMDLRASSLGLGTGNVDLTTASGAQSALSQIDTALSTLADAFASIGAAQNRMDFAMANAATAVENFSAAESTIRDADMAAEMTEFSKNQILQQAGVSMLAQANSSAQAVLKLLG